MTTKFWYVEWNTSSLSGAMSVPNSHHLLIGDELHYPMAVEHILDTFYPNTHFNRTWIQKDVSYERVQVVPHNGGRQQGSVISFKLAPAEIWQPESATK
jgi:hypothetical protein